MSGTRETLALELAAALASLPAALQTPEDAAQLFDELGLPGAEVLPLLNGVALASVADTVATVVDEAATLAAAVAADDRVGVGVAMGVVLPALFTALDELETLVDDVRDALAAALTDVDDDVQELVAELPRRVLDWLLITRFERRRPLLADGFALLGVIDRTVVARTPDRPAFIRRRLDLGRLAQLVDDPFALLADVHGWGDDTATLDAVPLLRLVHALLGRVGLPSVLDPFTGELRSLAFTVRSTSAGPADGLELRFAQGEATGLDVTLSAPDAAVEVGIEAAGSLELDAGVRLDPPATLVPVDPTANVDGTLRLVIAAAASDEPVLLFGDPEGVRLTAASWHVNAGIAVTAGTGGAQAGLVVDAALEDGLLVVALGGADGFLASFLPQEFEVAVDLAARWDEHGLHLEGGAGLEVTIPLGLQIGPIRLGRLDLIAGVTPDGVVLAVRLSGGIELGPVAASVSGVGAAVSLSFEGDDLGPFGFAAAFVPPTGIGLAIDAGPVRGGGFIDFHPDEGRYTGILQLGIGEIGLRAVGILDTQLPDGRDGYSLLLLITADFPPIALPFGFALTGAGGLVGINRRVDIDALRDRFAAGTVGNILAPEDPIGDADALFDDLGAVFPPAGGVHVVGPTLQLAWTSIVTLDLGIFLELPGPSKVLLLGSVRAVVDPPGADEPFVQLRLDLIGVLDLTKRRLEFDAVLVDSHLFQVFELTGGAAFRLDWGDDPNVVMSIGGFHPRFDPAPLVFPSSLTRIAMTRGRRSDNLYLRFEAYVAFTSNTLQLGANAELVLRAGGFVAEGSFGFDVLIRFQPFSFDLEVRASVSITYRRRTLASVKVRGELTGPGPVEFAGELEIEILFFSISWSGSFQFGDPDGPPIETVDDLIAQLRPALTDPTNLMAVGDDRTVTIAVDREAPRKVVPPATAVTWQQTQAPLGLLLETFHGSLLRTPQTLEVTGDDELAAIPVEDAFAAAMFVQLSDAEKLDRAAFDPYVAGITLATGDGPRAAEVTRTVDFAEFRIPDLDPDLGLWAGSARPLPTWLLDAADGLAVGRPERTAAVTVGSTRWARYSHAGDQLGSGLSQGQAHQLVRHGGGGTVIVQDDVLDLPAF